MQARPRRSALYMPASNRRAIDKARTLPCDVVILDLEDAVAPERKVEARTEALAALAEGGFGKREVVVRVNGLATEWGRDDLEALRDTDVDAVLLPKVGAARDICPAVALLDGATALWVMIETARSVLRLEEIAGAPGVTCLVMGTNDLARELGAQPGPDRLPFIGFLANAVAAARASGIAVLDGVFNAIDDSAGLERECCQAVSLGFDGKTLIHPDQVAPCNAAFSPNPAAIEWAVAVRDAFADPANAGRGAIRLGNQMVERLHLDQSARILALAEADRASR